MPYNIGQRVRILFARREGTGTIVRLYRDNDFGHIVHPDGDNPDAVMGLAASEIQPC